MEVVRVKRAGAAAPAVLWSRAMSGPKRLRGGRLSGRTASRSPSKVAEAAVKHESRARPSGDVTLTLRITICRANVEQLTTRAIREGKKLNAVVAESLEAELVG